MLVYAMEGKAGERSSDKGHLTEVGEERRLSAQFANRKKPVGRNESRRTRSASGGDTLKERGWPRSGATFSPNKKPGVSAPIRKH